MLEKQGSPRLQPLSLSVCMSVCPSAINYKSLQPASAHEPLDRKCRLSLNFMRRKLLRQLAEDAICRLDLTVQMSTKRTNTHTHRERERERETYLLSPAAISAE